MKKNTLIGLKSLGNLEFTRMPIEESVEPPPADGLILPGIQAKQDIERVKSISYQFSVGYADRIGYRDNMEDKIVICGNFRNHPDEDYMAIFDGHAGKEASAYCADNMHLFLESLLNQQKDFDIPSCITESFNVTHERMKTHKSQDGNFIESGTTALIALFKDDDLFIANAGDSRAVFCKNKTSQLITEDHKPTSDRELKRINAITGGFVIKNRVQGKLAVSRAIGDYKLNPYVTEIPDVFGPYKWKDPEYEFLILACDGLWDVMKEQTACDYVRRCRDPREAAVKLRDCAYEERSKDNISVIVIWFPGFVPDEPIIQEPKKSQPFLRSIKPPTSLCLPSTQDSESEEEDDEDDDDEEEDDNSDEDEDEEEESEKSKSEREMDKEDESDKEESSKSENEENGITTKDTEKIHEKSGTPVPIHFDSQKTFDSPRDHENGSVTRDGSSEKIVEHSVRANIPSKSFIVKLPST